MARSLDFNKIKHRIKSTSISSEEALKDIDPIEWPKEVLSGERKVEITHVTKCNQTDIGATIKYV